jgi:hypothetical protein
MWQSLDLRPVGDAGGHDGTGRDSDDAVCQLQMSHLTHRYRPTAARAVAQLQQLPQVLCQTQICSTPQSPWETPEATTAAKRCVRQQQLRLNHRFAAVAQLQQLPQVLCQTQICSTPQSPWETPEATTAAKRCVRQQQLRLNHRFAAVAQLQQLPQVLCQTQICSTPQSPWETPEAVTARAAIRTTAIWQRALRF